MKNSMAGFFLSLQFFTSIPIKRKLGMNSSRVYSMLQSLPLIGLVLGGITAVLLYILASYTPLSPLACAFIIWLFPILLTGGLHLDGWMDACDAYFSYRDREKRLEIMKDPRTGAFGVLSVLILLFAKFLFIYESIQQLAPAGYALLIIIPVLSRAVTGRLLISLPPAREEGIAFFFHSTLKDRRTAFLHSGCLLFLIAASFFLHLLSFFLLGAAAIFLLAKRFIIREFGGMTGDTLGACLEGGECLLWMMLWLFHYGGMV
ncbi:adenosylcobinamide-GDP ribazoletransferase [Metabacillus sp. GX 13764]|uniref:adenosylcobinamide-GDP ribazoletransferase n=1 Tax=Metabacillus kandeliae TaxID=2900151 RepID=UPI001E51F32F|nr:adenosylcobinamide-GDP ribazoletransferase [Metabacillus kandeliae]MCD7035510.1 adenosylcobinamide-GDP ribazoletransferase [Metabacillus kandeliae]